MNAVRKFTRTAQWLSVVVLSGVIWAGCATAPKVDWNSRIGSYSFDQAVLDYGPPDRSAKLEDGTVVAEWLTYRGYGHGYIQSFSGSWIQHYEAPPRPNYYLRLTFGPDGKLKVWKRIIK